MIETINGKAYFKVGDKVYEVGGGSNIITADSVEQLPDPASVPEGTIALVKSEGGGGLPTVELETPFEENALLSESDCAKLTAAIGSPIIVKYTTEEGVLLQIFAAYGTIEGMHVFLLYGNSGVMSEDGNTWGYIPNL